MDNQKDLLDSLFNDDEQDSAETLYTETVSEEIGIIPAPNRDNNGRFGAGNTMGRINKGKKTKTTNEMKAWLMQFITDKTEDMYEVWDELRPRDKAALFVQIVKYVMPTEGETAEDQTITIVMKPAEKKTYE